MNIINTWIGVGIIKEIGGFLEFDFVNKGSIYHDELIPLNMGRSALQYILRAKKFSKIYLPKFLCDCIRKEIEKLNIDYEYYCLDKELLPILKKEIKNNEILLLVNYYGQLSGDDINKYKKYNVILDNTQDFFSKVYGSIDVIYNARKYFGIPDGAFLYTKCDLQQNIEQDKVADRISHIIGRYESNASDYYEDFLQAEQKLDSRGLRYMSRFSKNILKGMDFVHIKEKREKNFNYLHKFLKRYNRLKIRKIGSYMYPFMIDHANVYRQELIKNKIYIPLLWPNVLKETENDSIEYGLAENILPIPIDQRYDINDMRYIIKTIIDIHRKMGIFSE